MTAEALVRAFWTRMGSNDFAHAAALFTEDFTCDWPQSGERIVGAEAFAAVNHAYPAAGPWRFTLHRLVASAAEAVTDVSVTDGQLEARAISVFDIRGDRIAALTEYWPDPMPASAWRRKWVVPIPGRTLVD